MFINISIIFNTYQYDFLYTLTMTERQKSTPRTISFVTTEEQLAALNRLAKEQERSISWLIRKALDEYLNKSK